MRLMRDWGEFDESKAQFGSKGHPVLFSYLPESFLVDLIETFDCVIRTNSKECRAFLPETAVAIYEFCLGIMRTD